MLFVLLCLQTAVLALPVLSKATLPPPKDIQVDKWQLRWSPATEERNITYTVQYRGFLSSTGTDEWKDVAACVQIAVNSCNVSYTKSKGEHGCVMLRVLAERHGLTSTPLEACSRHGDSCTPEFSLTARPGSLTVHLTRTHSLGLEFADHAKHRIYYGKQGEQLQRYKDAATSETIEKLEEGQRYCVVVEYVVFKKPVGMASCMQCELIPEPDHSTQTVIIVAVVVIILLVAVVPALAYTIIFQHEKIKRCLQPRYEMPELFLEPLPRDRILFLTSSPSDEHCDDISFISPRDYQGR